MEATEPRNCRRCGKLFLSTGPSECPACLEAAEEVFERVRLYLIENPGASLDRVAKATGVPAEAILRYLREGRLQARGREAKDGPPVGGHDPGRVHSFDRLRDRLG